MEFKGFNQYEEPVFFNEECCCFHVETQKTEGFVAYDEDLVNKFNTGKGECLNNCDDEHDNICRYEKTVGAGKKKRNTKSFRSSQKNKSKKNKSKKYIKK